MENKVIDWLLSGPVWLKYAVEKQLLESKVDISPVLADPTIAEIIKRLKNRHNGIPAINTGFMNSDEYETPYWDLFLLADLGIDISEAGLNREIDEFLRTQSADGTFMTEIGMEPRYFCKSSILLSSIARMGYSNDPHVKRFKQIFLETQRLDQGWYCNPNHDIGASLQYEPSCPQENLNNLLLIGQYQEHRQESRFNGAIDLLLEHWGMRNTGCRIVYFGVGRRYQSLSYPATRYSLLRVMDAISLFPYSMKKANFHSMLEFVRHKATEGKYSVEIPSPYTDLEPQNEPSRLLTFLISRIEKRVEESY